ncbi:hypothetical protein CA13_01450 [Planctomycetes bacterium CA13]|uniref:Tetratricopeptide repeat protein n=1 Tax=Novipirellula herctigrandis TaxID=2527986 RepID=A0A5C5YUR9_9BACT|nr:hypothetical protein CA13_01450 [Planctomycetes bacterium CA13]
MKPIPGTIEKSIRTIGWDTAFFLLAFFLYVWLVIDPHLIHHSLGITMPLEPFSVSIGWSFFAEHLSRPGGLVEYAARWLTQFFWWSWAGALIISCAAYLMCLAMDVLAFESGFKRGHVARYVPAMMMLVAWAGYNHPIRPVLSVLTALGGFVLYLVASRLSVVKRPVLLLATSLLAISTVVYITAGPSAGLLFNALVAIYETFVKRRWPLGVAAVCVGALVPWAVGMALFQNAIRNAYDGFFIHTPGVESWCIRYMLIMHLIFPATLATTTLFHRFRKAKAGSPESRTLDSETTTHDAAANVRVWLNKQHLWGASQIAIVFSVAGVIAWSASNVETRRILRINDFAQRGMWPQVLSIAQDLPKGQYNVYCIRNIQLALYHAGAGQLSEDMFRYTQVPGISLLQLPKAQQTAYTSFQESQVYLQLGQVNLAQRCACEALETLSDSPELLEHLAVINILKDRPETAMMFLRERLKKPFHRRTARAMLSELEEDPQLASDPRVRQLRKLMIRTDHAGDQTNEEVLKASLQDDPNNRFAFELLIANYLHTGRTDKIIETLAHPLGLKFQPLPRHIQEAIVVYSLQTYGRMPEPNAQIGAHVIDQAIQFDRIGRRYGTDNQGAQAEAIAAGLGTTFYFYFKFGASGL